MVSVSVGKAVHHLKSYFINLWYGSHKIRIEQFGVGYDYDPRKKSLVKMYCNIT